MSIPPSVLAALMGSLDRPVPLSPKACAAHNMIRNKPEAWFKDSPIDDRDRALINAGPAPFVSYGQRSYLRKMVRNITRQFRIVKLRGSNVSNTCCCPCSTT